jgi:hypothetical protein
MTYLPTHKPSLSVAFCGRSDMRFGYEWNIAAMEGMGIG